MTVSINNRRFESPGNGTTVVFAGPRIFSTDQLAVYLVDNATLVATLLTLTTDYTVSGLGDDECTITMVVAPADGKTLLRLRTIPFAQTIRFKNQGAFLPELHENMADLLAMQIQQLQDLIARTVTLSENFVGTLPSLALPTPDASKLLGWNSSRTALQNYSVGELITGELISGNFIVDDFEGDGAELEFNLSADPGVKANTQVYVDGVYVEKSEYSTEGSLLTMTSAPGLGAKVEVVQAGAVPINTPADASVGFYTINADGTGMFLRRTGTGLAWSNEFNQNLVGAVGARVDFNADVSTPIANGVALPTSTTFNSAANFHNDALTGSDGTGSWQTDPTAFSWWQKSGTALYRNMRLVVGSSAGMATLELDGALQAAAATLTGRAAVGSLSETRQTVAATTSTTLNLALGMVVTLTQDTNITTLAFSNVPATGAAATVTIKRVKDATGSARTITWPASVKWPGGVAPTLSATSGAIDIITLLTEDGGTTWFGSYGLAYA